MFKHSPFGVVEAVGVEVIFNAITPIQNVIQIMQSVQKLRPPQKFKRPPF
jgi:hypothetical protein